MTGILYEVSQMPP